MEETKPGFLCNKWICSEGSYFILTEADQSFSTMAETDQGFLPGGEGGGQCYV